MPRMTEADMLLAAEWLDHYEDDSEENNEAEACRRVAAFLRAEVERKQKDALVRATARKHGVPASVARKAVNRAIARAS